MVRPLNTEYLSRGRLILLRMQILHLSLINKQIYFNIHISETLKPGLIVGQVHRHTERRCLVRFCFYSRGFAAQTNALAPQLPSRHSRGVTNIQNITTKSSKFSGVGTEVELILARMRVFKRR